MQMDHVDLYYLHAPDYHVPIDQTLRAMDDMVRSGKVRYVACSNFRAWRLCEALWTSDKLGLNRFACVQPLYNIVNRDVEVELLPLCREHSVGVVSYSPLARGILTGKYKREDPADTGRLSGANPFGDSKFTDRNWIILNTLREVAAELDCEPAQAALAWAMARPGVASTLVGARTVAEKSAPMAATVKTWG